MIAKLSGIAFLLLVSAASAATLDLGTRLEPLVDDYLIESASGNVALALHAPTPREVALVHDQPWEGNVCCYDTVFQDGDRYRMYYRGAHFDLKTRKKAHPEVVCYAESRDGVHWTKPDLGLVEFRGSKQNNIIWSGPGTHNFAPFKDANPACKPAERYKALATRDDKAGTGLLPFVSADGIHWSPMQAKPVITKGAFDSQNIAFWDSTRNRYVEFHRGSHEGVRDIMTSTSTDFLHWSDPVWLDYPGAAKEHLYTNAITPYFRAPHIFFGFPKRFMEGRIAVKLFESSDGVSDGLFMTSRDGVTFHRWGEAFIRPGLQPERWVNRNNMTAWGIVATKSDLPGVPDEISLYSTEHYYQGDACRLRRFTVRPDGFVSLRADSRGGEMLTRPLRFSGKSLEINYSTSAAGSIRVEIQDAAGKPIPGFALADCPEIYGDQITRTVAWKHGNDLSKLAGQPIRLRFVMKDADLYALRFP
jgi:hypothetical protein